MGTGWGSGEADVLSSIPPTGDRGAPPPHAGTARSGPSVLAPGPALRSSQKRTSERPPWCRGGGGGNAEELLGVLDPALVRARGVPWKGVESSVS